MIRILYVEDNDDNVYMLRVRFELDGFEMLVADDGEAGCTKAIAEKPDVILMDLDLPVVDGWEASRVTSAGALGAGLSPFGMSSCDFCSCARKGRSANSVSKNRARIRLLIGLTGCINPDRARMFLQ